MQNPLGFPGGFKQNFFLSLEYFNVSVKDSSRFLPSPITVCQKSVPLTALGSSVSEKL